ncbi:hypothetical protein Hanom_Chr15g01346531 [Helianthus anomalus]
MRDYGVVYVSVFSSCLILPFLNLSYYSLSRAEYVFVILAHIANVILSAPEGDVAVATLRAKVRDARYKVGYTECLTHVNALLDKKFTDEQCRSRDIDTKGELNSASQVYNTLPLPILA